MSKRFLWPAFLIMVVALSFAGVAIYRTYNENPRVSFGRLAFPRTVENGLHFDRLDLTFPGHQLNFFLENNYWVLKQADYYYANMDFLNKLFSDINQSVNLSQQPLTPEKQATLDLEDSRTHPQNGGVVIQTFAQNQLLDSLIIGKPTVDRHGFYSRAPGSDHINTISGQFNLPPETLSWFAQPVLNYRPEQIEKIALKDGKYTQTASRGNKIQPFYNQQQMPVKPEILLEQFNFMIALQARSAQNFDETAFLGRRQISLTSFGGLVTEIDLYHNQKEYWIKISLSSTRLPTSLVNAYIKDNAFRYDNWYFQLPASSGRILANFNIIRG